MTLSIWDTAMIAAWIVVWFTIVGIFFSIISAATKKRKERKIVLSAASLALAEKIKKSVYTQEEFDEIVRTMNEQGEK